MKNVLTLNWKSFGNIYSKSQVNDFAAKATKISMDYDSKALWEYGKKLVAASASYNIDLMKSLILDFPDLINKMKEANKI